MSACADNTRKVRTTRTTAVLTGAALLAPLGLLAATGNAAAADSAVWDRIAKCERRKLAHQHRQRLLAELQFSAGTWRAYGGTAYASTADKASKTAQIAVATKVQNAQGWGAWPTCSARAGAYGNAPASSGGSATTKSAPKSTSQSASKSAPKSTTKSAPAQASEAPARASGHTNRAASRGDYTVRGGDTLSAIAERHGTTWPEGLRRQPGGHRR